ncbi:MAG: SDR family oxidoreductase [Candidatus Binataceae bacterium]
MDLLLKDKTALVFGGSKGLGRGVAEALAAEGVAVALVARGKEALEQAAAAIKVKGGRALALAADLANWPQVEAAVKTTREQLGPIDILLNNSGGPPPSGVNGLAPEVWETQFNAMVLPIIRLTDLVLPEMRARKWGRIINVASTSVIEPIPVIGLSNTLRASIAGWAKTLAGEVARDGITVNTLLPGAIETDRVKQVQRATAAKEGLAPEEIGRRAGRGIPVGRLGTPAEFGAVAAFIASPLASYVTGSLIRVDGGAIRAI